MSKNIGTGFYMCPVCMEQHGERVLFNMTPDKALASRNFTDWRLCRTHQDLYESGHIFAVGTLNKPEGPLRMQLATAIRSGGVVAIKRELWGAFFNVPPPQESLAPMVWVPAAMVPGLQERAALFVMVATVDHDGRALDLNQRGYDFLLKNGLIESTGDGRFKPAPGQTLATLQQAIEHEAMKERKDA